MWRSMFSITTMGIVHHESSRQGDAESECLLMETQQLDEGKSSESQETGMVAAG